MSSLEKWQCQYGIETLSGAHKTTLNGSSAYNINERVLGRPGGNFTSKKNS